jgi:pimeloyl-ACP methyl ester carboxylesterase
MSTPVPCEQSCASAALTQGPVILSDAVARFEREAARATLATPRYRMGYYVWGAGPPLVFVQGAGDTSHSFLPVISLLSSRFRCIAFDLPGLKGDGANLWRTTHDNLVDSLFALLDHLNLPRAYVLGSSFGTTVVLRALRRHPERIPRAILQGGFAHRPLRRIEWWLSWLARILPGRTARMPKREKVLGALHLKTFEGRGEEWWRAYLDWTGVVPISTLCHQAQMIHRLDLRADLPHIRQPVLILVGEKDLTIPTPHAEMLLHGLPNGGLVMMEGVGHVPQFSHPEMMAEIVRQFLTPPDEASCPMYDVCHGDAQAVAGSPQRLCADTSPPA